MEHMYRDLEVSNAYAVTGIKSLAAPRIKRVRRALKHPSLHSHTHTRMCTFDTALMHHHQHGIHTCTCKHAYHNHFPLNSFGCYTEVFVMWVRSFNSGLEVLARRDVRRQEVARAGRAFFCRDPRDCVSA